MSIIINILLALNVLVSLLIILLVLMQRPKSEGLGAAFGGGMTENIFGAGTTNALQTMTRYLGALFFFLSLALSWLYVKQSSYRSNVQQRLMAPSVVPAAATPEPKPAPSKAAPDDKIPAATPAASKPGASAPAPAPAASAPATTPAPASATPPPSAPSSTPAAAPAPAKTETPAPAASAPATPAPSQPAPDSKPADKPN